jgi:hypothetical protein
MSSDGREVGDYIRRGNLCAYDSRKCALEPWGEVRATVRMKEGQDTAASIVEVVEIRDIGTEQEPGAVVD